MASVAGDVADGLIGHPMCSLRWLDEVLVANFEHGLERSGRRRAEFDFLPAVCCAIAGLLSVLIFPVAALRLLDDRRASGSELGAAAPSAR
jgi:hypothetical protein